MLFLLRPPQTQMPYAVRRAHDSTVPVEPPPPPSAPANDLVANLEALAQLRDSGALSDEEFQTAKTKLLDAS